MVSGFLIPAFLALLHTLLSPLATFSLNPKHSLTSTSEGHLSIIFLSEEASVFSSGNKFKTGDNWSSSCSLSVNLEMYPLKKKMQFLLLKIQMGFLLLHSCYKEFGHRSILSLDFTEKWTEQDKLPLESSRPDLVLCPPNPSFFSLHSCVCMLSHSVMSSSLWPHGLLPTRLLCPWDSPSKNTGVGCHSLLQGIFLTQWLNQHLLYLLHWQADSLPLLYLGSPFA